MSFEFMASALLIGLILFVIMVVIRRIDQIEQRITKIEQDQRRTLNAERKAQHHH